MWIYILFACDRVHFVPGMRMWRLLSDRDANLSVALELLVWHDPPFDARPLSVIFHAQIYYLWSQWVGGYHVTRTRDHTPCC